MGGQKVQYRLLDDDGIVMHRRSVERDPKVWPTEDQAMGILERHEGCCGATVLQLREDDSWTTYVG